MWKYLIRAIILACLSGLAVTVVSADEGEDVITPENSGGEHSELNRDVEELEREDERLWREIGDVDQDTNRRVDDTISYLGIGIGVLTFIITVTLTLITVIITLTGILYRKDYIGRIGELKKEYVKETDRLREIEIDARRALREARETSETVIDFTQKELDIFTKTAKSDIESALRKLPPISEIEEKRDLVASILEEYPTLRRSTDFLYEAAKKRDITDVPTLENIAESLYINEEYSKSLDITGIIETLMPRNPFTYYNKGLVLSNLGLSDEAIRAYNDAIKLKPDYPEAYNNKAVEFNKSNRHEEALEAALVAIELKPEYAKAYYNKGIALNGLSRYNEAVEAYDLGIILAPDTPEGYNSKGIALYNLGRYDESIKAYDKAIELKPDYAVPYNNKGNALYRLGKHDEAMEAYDKAIELNPEFAEAYDNKGAEFIIQEKYDEAIKVINIAIGLKPGFANAYCNRACAYSLLGEKDKMLSDLEKAIEFDEKYRDKAKDETDFEPYRDDPDFRRLIFPEEFEGEESG